MGRFRNIIFFITILPKRLVWFFKRIFASGKEKIRRRKSIYTSHLEETESVNVIPPISSPPWNIKPFGVALCLTKHAVTQTYHAAKANRYIEICGVFLGKKFADLFIGISFIEIGNILRSSYAALPSHEHVQDVRKEIASRYPALDVVGSVHSHPNSVILRPSKADLEVFKNDTVPNVIVAPSKLYSLSPLHKMVAFYAYKNIVHKIPIIEIDEDVTGHIGLDSIDLSGVKPTEDYLLFCGEIAIEINFAVFKLFFLLNPNCSISKLSSKVSSIFEKDLRFNFYFKHRDGWKIAPSNMPIVNFFLRGDEYVCCPEFFEEVK